MSWQVPDHAVPLGRGAASTGFKSAAPGTAGLPLVSNGASADPSFQALSLAYVRERLSAARTYYVRTDGNDNNTGLVNTAGGAFLTIGRAIAIVGTTLDLYGQSVTIQLVGGPFNESPSLIPYLGRTSQGHTAPTPVVIQGDHASPSSVVVNGGFTAVEAGLYEWVLRDFKIVGGTANSVYADLGGWIVIDNIDFGATTANHMAASFGYVEPVSNYTISGGAFSHFLSLNSGHVLYSAGLTVTLTGTPAFTGAFAYQQSGGYVGVPVGTVFTGAATGTRWNFDYTLELAGVPGDIASLNAMFPGNATGAYIPLPIVQGGTGSTTATGSGSVVLATSPTMSNPTITGHVLVEGVVSTGATGTGNLVFSASPTFTGTVNATGDLNITKAAGVLTEALTASASNIQVVYTAAGGVQYFLKDSSAGADLKYFQLNASGGTFVFNSLTDVGAIKTAFLTLNSSTSKIEVTAPITSTSSILSTSATLGVGYATGAGGTITQGAGSGKATAATLSKASGAITMNNAALAAATIVSFVLTNTAIAATDVLVLNHISGGTIGAYTLNAQCAAGSATINVRNNTAGSLSDAIVIQFAVVKGVNA